MTCRPPSVIVLLLLGALMATSRAAAQTGRPDTVAWRKHLAFLSSRGGTWLTSNDQYRTDQNGEPHRYGMRYRTGFGGTTQHGCLWGESPAQPPAVFWHFFTAWDPVRGALLVQQSGATGVVGIGYEFPDSGVAEQTFTAPDGTRWEIRHLSEHRPPDTLITRSFQRTTGDWEPRRAYTWVRQPSDAPAPCP